MKWHDGACNKHFTCSWNGRGREMQPGRCGTMAKDDVSQRRAHTVVYTLDDADGFYKTIADQYGIDKSWVKLADKVEDIGCKGSVAGAGNNRTKEPIERVGPCRPNKLTWKSLPQRDDNMKVPNPKEVVSAAEKNLTAVQRAMSARPVKSMLAVGGCRQLTGFPRR